MRATTKTLNARLQEIERRVSRLDVGGKRGRPLDLRARVLELETRHEALTARVGALVEALRAIQ